jgi:two-component sensor histidine kinase
MSAHEASIRALDREPRGCGMRNDDAERIARLEADNRRLRVLLDRSGAAAELRHRLRNMVALLRMVIRRSAQTPRDIESFVAHIEDRLDVIMRTHGKLDEADAVDLHLLVAEEMLRYGESEGGRLRIDGPAFELDRGPALVLALAIHELAANAIEHGPLGAGAGTLDVRWKVVAGELPRLRFVWTEVGPFVAPPSSHAGFGSGVLTKMVRYELDATVSFELRDDEVRWSMEAPMSKLRRNDPRRSG